MAIDLAGRVPRVVSAISGRLIYLAVVILVIGVGFVAYGFKYREHPGNAASGRLGNDPGVLLERRPDTARNEYARH